MKKRQRPVGEFCWFNLMTPETDRARDFYRALFRWSYDELPGVGHIVKVNGSYVGGIFDVVNPKTNDRVEPMIGVMIRVDDADAIAKQIIAAGGKALPPFDIMDSGRMSVCHDPGGAEFDVWQPKKQPGTDVDPDVHGAPTWFELRTNDVDRCAAFYGKIFGWVPETMAMPGHKYTTFQLKDTRVGGMVGIIPAMGEMKPHWQMFLTVDDVDQTAKEAGKLGANLVVPPTDIPGVGRFAAFRSPQKVPVLIIKRQ